MAEFRDPMSSPGRREVVGDTPPDVLAAARHVVLRRYETGQLSADEAAVVLAMLGLVADEAVAGAAGRLGLVSGEGGVA